MRSKSLLLISSILCFAFSAFAGLLNAPPNFELSDGSGRAVFVNFESAQYDLIFDIPNQETHVKTIIQFQNDEKGMPIFDLVDEPTKIELDGQIVTQRLIETPHDVTSSDFSQIRMVQKVVPEGIHQLVIEHELKAFPATFQSGAVQSGFFMSDFEARGLLERYVPANFEFDQVPMLLNVTVVGGTKEEIVFANGDIQKNAENVWSIQFPSYFNGSSVYFNIRPTDTIETLQYLYESSDGRQLPVMIYRASGSHNDVDEFKKTLNESLTKFESLFGPFPHPAVTVFINDIIGAGMEYAGAMTTDIDSLPHELAHSYFGRGIMPANGNAGWIDEAMASYAGGPTSTSPNDLKPISTANHSPYFRANDSQGYYYGQNFLIHLGNLFKAKSPTLSLNNFLKNWLTTRIHQPITTEILKKDLEQYSGLNLKSDFQKYICATPPPAHHSQKEVVPALKSASGRF